MSNPDQIYLRAVGDPLLEHCANFALGPVSLRRVFLLMTRIHFSDANNYGPQKEALANFVWHKDANLRKLNIELDYIFDAKRADLFPGVYVGVGDIDYKQKVTDNRDSSTEDRSGTNRVMEGATTIILRHASQQPDECLQLAELSFGFYTGIREMLMDKMRLSSMDVRRLSTPRFFTPDSSTEADRKFCADIIMGISFNASWTTFCESHRIKTITFGQTINEFAT